MLQTRNIPKKIIKTRTKTYPQKLIFTLYNNIKTAKIVFRSQKILIKQSQQNYKLIKTAALCGILASFIILVFVLLATWLSPWFSWQKHALSNLGVGEVSTLFNGTVIVGGLLNFFFYFGFKEYATNNSKTSFGVGLLMLSSLCLALVGVFTIESSLMHALVALGFFLFAPIGLLFIGFSDQDHKTKKTSLTMGSLALIVILVLPLILDMLSFEVGFAVPEIFHALILGTWTLSIAVKMIRFQN